ncbi:MAG: type II secretion system protein [Campylobacterota bacterium]|nr:type II secretion system protein [Campylobacterota bacterium]
MKKSFTLLELIFTFMLIGIISSVAYTSVRSSKLDLATSRILLYLEHTKYLASIQNHYNKEEDRWFKKLWTFKFQRCRKSVGGLYFIVYSDKDMDGFIDKNETALDPLTSRHLYSSNWCNEKSALNNKYVLLSNQYNIQSVEVSCNATSSIGQISFDQFGRIYSKLDSNEFTNEIKNDCIITIKDENEEENRIKISSKTGFITQIE